MVRLGALRYHQEKAFNIEEKGKLEVDVLVVGYEITIKVIPK